MGAGINCGRRSNRRFARLTALGRDLGASSQERFDFLPAQPESGRERRDHTASQFAHRCQLDNESAWDRWSVEVQGGARKPPHEANAVCVRSVAGTFEGLVADLLKRVRTVDGDTDDAADRLELSSAVGGREAVN